MNLTHSSLWRVTGWERVESGSLVISLTFDHCVDYVIIVSPHPCVHCYRFIGGEIAPYFDTEAIMLAMHYLRERHLTPGPVAPGAGRLPSPS